MSADDAGSQGPRIEEARPWKTHNTDGTLNLGSFQMQAALGMMELAQELWQRQYPCVDVDRDTITKLGKNLLTAADRVQRRLRADHHVDRQDNSHTRARGAVRSAVEVLPVPWEEPMKERLAWLVDIEEHAVWLVKTAASLLEGPGE